VYSSYCHIVGKNNRRCLCASCERKGIGGYIIESDWSLHSSETEGDEARAEQPSGLEAPRPAKKRRSELDNLKENLTDLMKAPILPVSGSEDSDAAEKDRDREREKRREKKKDKGKKKKAHSSDAAGASSKDKVISKDGSTSTVAGKVAQLPTPSTTHSYASTSGGTPKQDDLHDDDPDAVPNVGGKGKRRSRSDPHLITPPPSAKTHSGEEAEDPSDEEEGPPQRLTRSLRKSPTKPAPAAAPKKKGKDPATRTGKPGPSAESGSDESKEGGGSSSDSDSSNEERSNSTSSDEEERRRVYAFRHRRMKGGPLVAVNGATRLSGRRGIGGGSGNGTGTPVGAANPASGKAGNATSANAGGHTRYCITCRWNELTAKNETTCGRLVFISQLLQRPTTDILSLFLSGVNDILIYMALSGPTALVTPLWCHPAAKALHRPSSELETFWRAIIQLLTASLHQSYDMPTRTRDFRMTTTRALSSVAAQILVT
jgi:hypothetical protein